MKNNICFIIFIICFTCYKLIDLYYQNKENEMFYENLSQSTKYYNNIIDLLKNFE